MDKAVLERAQRWLSEGYDEETRQQVQELMDKDPEALSDAFYRDLEFGTGGLRGIMGVGTNRMNKYTVGMATQGLANYLKRTFSDLQHPKVAIAYDCRINSEYFARITAEVLSANGIQVFLFDALRPVPLLSFAVRELSCQAGVVITASHNPKEYNGYKVYWEDGGQLVPPHDNNIIAEVQKITRVSQIRFDKVAANITMLDESFDNIYLEKITGLSLSPDTNKRHSDLKIVFSPLHGSAVRLVPAGLRSFGFEQVFNIPEQDRVDGRFPTVKSPNPEDPAAFEMALGKAREVDADLVMTTDPDCDRLGVAIKDPDGQYMLLNGNQTAALLTYYVLDQWKQQGRYTGNEYIVKTIVTSGLLSDIAADYDVTCLNVLTGFKYIAEKIRELEGQKRFLCGGEESYGFLVGDLVRDKDAVISCCMIAEVAAWARDQGLTLYALLMQIYRKYGLYVETLLSITRKGQKGAGEISQMMDTFRKQPPETLDGKQVARMIDYYEGTDFDLRSRKVHPVDLPTSNVLQFVLEDATMITLRPSGTEPKIKFYFGCKGVMKEGDQYGDKRAELLDTIGRIKKEMGVT